MITIVQGKQAGAETQRTGSRRARRNITATNPHVLEVPRAYTWLTGQSLQTLGLPDSEAVIELRSEAVTASLGS